MKYSRIGLDSPGFPPHTWCVDVRWQSCWLPVVGTSALTLLNPFHIARLLGYPLTCTGDRCSDGVRCGWLTYPKDKPLGCCAEYLRHSANQQCARRFNEPAFDVRDQRVGNLTERTQLLCAETRMLAQTLQPLAKRHLSNRLVSANQLVKCFFDVSDFLFQLTC
jgi:hypothetical protein